LIILVKENLSSRYCQYRTIVEHNIGFLFNYCMNVLSKLGLESVDFSDLRDISEEVDEALEDETEEQEEEKEK